MQAKNEMQAIKALNTIVAEIVESGSNANGSWVKYADGTMIQWGSATFTGAETGNTGSYTRVLFPQPFANNKISTKYQLVYKSGIDTTLTMFIILIGSIEYGKGTAFTQDTVYRRLSYTYDNTELAELYAIDLPFNWQAIGFWK